MSKVGTRLARATGPEGVQFGMSSTSNLQIAITFKFTNPEDEYFGHVITWMGSFAPGKASEITLEAMENCGWSGDDVMNMTGIDSNEVELVIIEEYNEEKGRAFDKVKFVNRAGANRFAFQRPVEGSALASQAKTLNQSIRAIRASQGRKPSAPQNRQQPPRQAPPARQQPQSNESPEAINGDNEFPF